MKRCLFVIIFLIIINNYAQEPPLTWQEHWFEHNQLLSRVFYDDDVAIYYDKDTPPTIIWPFKYCGDVSRYLKKVYGPLSPENRIYIILHTNKYSGGHPAYYYDASHDFRNVADNGPGPWNNPTYDLITHEIGHIVESTPYGLKSSPAFGIWGDSKWCEIFIYDVYKGLGMTSEATRWYNNCINQTLDMPVKGAHWFRDWFYPLYTQYGGSAFLARFFENLGKKWKGGGLNWGQYVHFTSCAAGTDLRSAFKKAFGDTAWTQQMETQFLSAQKDYPCLSITDVKKSFTNNIPHNISNITIFPNPLKTKTNISFVLIKSSKINIEIYKTNGILVTRVLNGYLEAGNYNISWNREDKNNRNISSGIYLLKINNEIEYLNLK